MEDVRVCVREQLAIVLSLPVETIRPESRILTDLEAESLDLLDLAFRLEDAFRIRLDPRELTEASEEGVTSEDFRERFTVEALSVHVLAKLGRSDAGD